MSMSFRLAPALTVVLLSVAGCAAESDEPESDTPASTVEVETETTIGPRYTARVTKADIVAGGGRCAGSLCTINGTMWNCGGGGYCSRIVSH